MKKAKTLAAATQASTLASSLPGLVEQIRSLVQSARHATAVRINSLHVLTNFEIGRLIVEHEQQGRERAAYGKETLKQLSVSLSQEFGRGFSQSNLEYMRKFYLLFQERVPAISQNASGKSSFLQIPASAFTLSWSHYVFLLGIQDEAERGFYEIEAHQNGWTLPELRRQFDTSLYERLALSRDKAEVHRLALEGQVVTQAADLRKDPYVLEFLGLDEKARYSESDLESAIIDRIEAFLLELGKGFLFEARQKRFTFDEEHFMVDLVFYNRLLRCYVLIDLKIGKLTHQDLGQMQMYVNYFDRFVKTPEEQATIGIILCKQKRDALVELTLPPDAQIHASEYKLYLPSKDDLRQRLMEWAGEVQA